MKSLIKATESGPRLLPERDRRVSKQTKVALFCGGRGCASLIREFVRWPQIELSLLINGYDDGLSTGHLRGLLANMLGPSDFRKNLARLLDLHSSEQYALQRFLEYRFTPNFSRTDICAFEGYIERPQSTTWLPAPLDVLFAELHPEIKRIIIDHLRLLLDFQRERAQVLNYADCSLGNLVFAGAYLKADSNFNTSVKTLTTVFHTPTTLLNVTRGENRILVALKNDGQILTRECEIVGPQSNSPISDVFLLERALDESEQAKLAALSAEEKKEFLSALDSTVSISPEADSVLRNADVIMYGPGTQFSSLLPSYRTRGVPLAIQESTAAVKIFVANIEEDKDIQGLTITDLVDNALRIMDDANGQKGLITHVLCNEAVEKGPRRLVLGRVDGKVYKSAAIVRGNFESPADIGLHSGYAVVRRAIDIFESACKSTELRSIEIYVDLLNRSRAVEQILQEMLDLPWTESFEHVQLRLNRLPVVDVKLPSYVSVTSSDYRGLFTEVEALQNWLAHSESDYLVTLTGDGQYRLHDILTGVQVLRSSHFGAVYGSRTQSCNQLRSSLDSAYGEHAVLRFLSFCAAFLFTAIFAVLFRVIMSDPVTGFRIYRRVKFTDTFVDELRRIGKASSAAVTRLMILYGIEIAEIPIVYRTYRGFTKPGWRIKRAFKNLQGLFR